MTAKTAVSEAEKQDVDTQQENKVMKYVQKEGNAQSVTVFPNVIFCGYFQV